VDVATFTQHFPEFAQTAPTLIAAKLAQASAFMGGPDASVWGAFATPTAPPAPPPVPTQADIAQGNLAAHYLWSSPFGTVTVVAPGQEPSTSPYLGIFEELRDARCGGFLVAGGC
jgi:hypothetical protein